MIAFIGLGNVGDQFKWTKHNAGFWVIDEFARRKKLSFNPIPAFISQNVKEES